MSNQDNSNIGTPIKVDFKSVAEALQAKAIELITADTSKLTEEQRKARREDATDTIVDCNMLEALSTASFAVVSSIEKIKQVPLLSSLQLIKALRGF